MTQQPKRRPGDRNARPDADACMEVVRESELTAGQGYYGIGGRSITRGLIALVGLLRRRRDRSHGER